MSIAQQNQINELKRRVELLEKRLADTAESLAYLHGHVLAAKDDHTLEPTSKLRTLSLPEKRKPNG